MLEAPVLVLVFRTAVCLAGLFARKEEEDRVKRTYYSYAAEIIQKCLRVHARQLNSVQISPLAACLTGCSAVEFHQQNRLV